MSKLKADSLHKLAKQYFEILRRDGAPKDDKKKVNVKRVNSKRNVKAQGRGR